jgi:hypothetical protein
MRRGRPRKCGHIYANGNLRPSAAQTNSEKTTVLNQPHRRGRDSLLCDCPLGRLVEKHKLRSEVYFAALSWGGFVRRWLTVKGVAIEVHTGSGRGVTPSDAMVQRWTKEILRIETALKRVSTIGFMAMRTLAVAMRDIYHPNMKRPPWRFWSSSHIQ